MTAGRWPDSGVVIRRGLLPGDLVDAYCELRAPMGAHGWADCTPYMRHVEIRDLCLCAPVVEIVEELIGDTAGLHLNLTGWVSTERTWHQDYYLNPPFIGDAYCGVWMALADIDPRSGPFEYVPGSHRWPKLLRAEVMAQLAPHERDDPDWPRLAERFVTGHWEQAIDSYGGQVKRFDARRGDVLFWHPRIVHRGSAPEIPGLERRSLIAHYSGVTARRDMPTIAEHAAGHYFVL